MSRSIRPGKTLSRGSEGLEQGGIGYRYGMNIVVIVVIVAIVVAIAVVLWKRRADQNAEALRNQAQDHRDEARASQIAATRQETEANALAAKAKADLAKADEQRNAAAVKREVASDLNVRADYIDPDVPNTSP
jgi:FtsZ-interacting cell division protein ZipA